MVAAFDEAIDWVNADKPRAAQFYLDVSKEKISREDLSKILMARRYLWQNAAPGRRGIEMLHKAGILQSKPQSWTDM